MENIAYFGTADSDHGISYTREAFHHLSRLNRHDRNCVKEALMAMRTDDRLDEALTETRRIRRLKDDLRFVFERSGSALAVLSISGGVASAPKGGDARP